MSFLHVNTARISTPLPPGTVLSAAAPAGKDAQRRSVTVGADQGKSGQIKDVFEERVQHNPATAQPTAPAAPLSTAATAPAVDQTNPAWEENIRNERIFKRRLSEFVVRLDKTLKLPSENFEKLVQDKLPHASHEQIRANLQQTLELYRDAEKQSTSMLQILETSDREQVKLPLVKSAFAEYTKPMLPIIVNQEHIKADLCIVDAAMTETRRFTPKEFQGKLAEDLAAEVFQRLTRYPMTLKEYVERLPKNDPRLELASDLQKYTAEKSTVINEARRAHQDNQAAVNAVEELQATIAAAKTDRSNKTPEEKMAKIVAKFDILIENKFYKDPICKKQAHELLAPVYEKNLGRLTGWGSFFTKRNIHQRCKHEEGYREKFLNSINQQVSFFKQVQEQGILPSNSRINALLVAAQAEAAFIEKNVPYAPPAPQAAEHQKGVIATITRLWANCFGKA